MHDDDLLSPSLLERKTVAPIYSMGALIAAAFFGGGLAVTMIASANSGRLQRIGKDLLWILLAGALTVGILVWAMLKTADQGAAAVTNEARLYVRAAGFGLCGVFFLRHRTAYRAMRVSVRPPPSPYRAVAIATLLAYAIYFMIAVTIESGVTAAK